MSELKNSVYNFVIVPSIYHKNYRMRKLNKNIIKYGSMPNIKRTKINLHERSMTVLEIKKFNFINEQSNLQGHTFL